MCKENLYAKMEKLKAQICRCTRQGLNPQAPDGVYKPPLVYCRMGFINTSPISRIAFEQKISDQCMAKLY